MPVKYLGSKKKLLPQIEQAIQEVAPPGSKVLDLFSGTARVGYHLKHLGYHVTGNDLSTFGYINALAYLEGSPSLQKEVKAHLRVMQDLPPVDGYFTETFCRKSLFFSVENGMKIDAIRLYLREARLDPVLRAILTVSLIEAADRVDSTVGLQMAYLKKYAKRASNALELRPLDLTANGSGKALQGDALHTASLWEGDIAYLDPPYNQHNYLGNYHIWETLASMDEPEVYGVACKRVDVKTRKSPFNSKGKALPSLLAVVEKLRCRHVILSYNNEGHIPYLDLLYGLESLEGCVIKSSQEIGYQRHVGSKIGIHSPTGEKVGSVKATSNVEYLITLEKRNYLP